MWLRDDLPKDLKNTRILLYGYNSELVGGKRKQNLHTHLESFYNELSALHSADDMDRVNRPLILIGHGLGCLFITKVSTSHKVLR